jgi:enoyl-CoA hydratase
MAFEQVVRYETEDRVAVITMNRPDKRNAINVDMREGLFAAFERARDDEDVWAVIITGAGGNFSSGHDLTMIGERARPGRSTDDLYLLMRSVWKPIIAAVEGYCLAQGAGMALCSDIRIAGAGASFGWPQVKRGISSISGPSLLAHSVPLCRAMELMLTGDFIGAEEAAAIGLVNRVVPSGKALDTAREIAAKICRNAPLAVRTIKEATIRGLGLPLPDRIRIAADLMDRVNRTEDAREGLQAFKEKREPVWKAR